jgi:hypothetical protein
MGNFAEGDTTKIGTKPAVSALKQAKKANDTRL